VNELPKCGCSYSADIDPLEKILKDISYAAVIPKRPENVVLVVPPSPQIPTPGREFLVTGPFEGFTYMATLVKKMGYNLKVVDCRLKENAGQLVLDAAKDADIVGIATYCDSFVFLQDITRAIKKENPNKLIFLGGPLVTSLPEIILQNTAADCAILSEGELTLIEFFDRHFDKKSSDLGDIKGMACKEGGEVKISSPRLQIKNLDNLPLLDYTIWPNYESIVKNGQILISSMRGCPQECSFCFKTIPGLRLKSLKRFEEEVAYLKKTTKFDYTWLNDLTFNVIEKRAMDVCGILKKYNVRYHCFARVQKVSKGLADTLKETGCLGIWFGLESYDQDVLDLNRKSIRTEEINNAVRIAREAGLAVRGLFIVGLYGETKESLKKMFDFIKVSDFLPLVKYLVPFPGTSLYKYALQTGKIKDVVEFLRMLSARKVSDHDDDIINITGLNEETLRDYFHQIWNITKERETCFES
jgi:radical SAM superfamily enzyme YgiQ (UPF0313 family)